jgi:hypothetical protein
VVHVPEPEACRHLQGTHPQAGQVGVGRGSAMWAGVGVPPCGRGMGVGVRFSHGGSGPDAGDGRERHVGCDAGIAVWDVRALALLSTNTQFSAKLILHYCPSRDSV